MNGNGAAPPARAHVGWIASVTPEAEGDVRFTLRDGTDCIVPHDSPWLDLWSRTIHASREYAWPVSVGRETDSGRVRLLLPATVHTVESVWPDPEDDGTLRVRLSGATSVRALKRRGHGRETRAARLRQAAETRRPVVITEDPLGGEIIDVRFAPEAPAAGA